MGHIQLTRGYIGKAMRGEELPPNPVIQILGIKVIPAQQGKAPRHRLDISDGEHTYNFALLAPSLNDLVTQNKISCFTVVSVSKMECSGGFKKIFMITSLEVKQYARLVGRKLGNPVPWVEPPSPELYPAHTDQSSSSTDSKGKSGTWNGNFAVPTNRPPQSRASSAVLGRGSLYNSSGSSSSNNSNDAAAAASGVSLYKCPDLSGQRGGASFRGNQARNAGHRHRYGNGENINSSRSEVNDAALVPIRDLSHVIRKVTIRARVTNKGQVKTWTNLKGNGKLFTIDLMDDSGQIQMTGFNQSVDQFYDAIEINNVYYFKNFQVQHARAGFSNSGHEYSLSFLPDTQVISYLKDSSSIPSLTFNFVSIDEISNIQPEAIVDVIGICKSYQEVQVVKVQSTGKELEKRELSLVDKTLKLVNITLWGSQAKDFADGSQPVIAVKGAKVSDFGGGRSLSVLSSSVFQLSPDLPEAHALRGWYDNEGFTSDFKSISGGLTTGIYGNSWTPRKVIAEATTLSPGNMEKSEYFVAKVTIISIKNNPLYKACIAEACNKKVVDLQNGLYLCEKCKVEQSSFKWRLLLQVNFSDFTGDFWASCFTEIGETIFEKSTEELALLYCDETDEFADVMKQAIFQQFIGKFRSRMETYKNEIRKKIDVLELNRIDHAEYAKNLLAEIQETRSS